MILSEMLSTMAECGVEGMDVRMDPADPWERRERPFISFLIDLKQNCSADLRAKVCPVVFPRRFRSAMFVLLDIVWPASPLCRGGAWSTLAFPDVCPVTFSAGL